MPGMHVRVICCWPLKPHDTLHGPQALQSLKWLNVPVWYRDVFHTVSIVWHTPAVQFCNCMPAPPSQLPQSPLLHCRVLFIHPAPHVTLHAPNDDHPVHVRGVPA